MKWERVVELPTGAGGVGGAQECLRRGVLASGQQCRRTWPPVRTVGQSRSWNLLADVVVFDEWVNGDNMRSTM